MRIGGHEVSPPRGIWIGSAWVAFVALFGWAAHAAVPPGNWESLPAPVSGFRYDDLTFVSPTTGFALDLPKGRILRTLDGGENWVTVLDAMSQLGYPVAWRSIAFATTTLGWAGNLNFTGGSTVPNRSLFETVNGGDSWQNISTRITGPSPVGICSIEAVTAEIVVAAGRWASPAMFIRTDDAGAHWTSLSLEPQMHGAVDVHFFDPDTGLVVGGYRLGATVAQQESSQAVILRTVDGGATWSTMYLGVQRGEWCWKISFPTRLTGYVSVESPIPAAEGVILKTIDGGESWARVPVRPGFTAQGIGFIDELRGWAAQHEGEMYGTVDGGATWDSIPGLPLNVNRIRFYGDTLAYAAGLTIYRFTGPSVLSAPAPPRPPAMALSPARPTPFAHSTSIAFRLLETGTVSLTILDVRGRQVRRLAREQLVPGEHTISWEGRDDRGREVPDGVYFCRLVVGGTSATRKLLRLR